MSKGAKEDPKQKTTHRTLPIRVVSVEGCDGAVQEDVVPTRPKDGRGCDIDPVRGDVIPPWVGGRLVSCGGKCDVIMQQL